MTIPKDRQGMFDHVVINLRKQGKVSEGKLKNRNETSSTMTCLYRDPCGNRCAGGWLIPDEDYDKAFEGAIVYTTDDSESKLVMNYFADKYGADNLQFIQALQSAHDYGQGYEGQELFDLWEKKWNELAYQYELTVPAK